MNIVVIIEVLKKINLLEGMIIDEVIIAE